MSRYKESNYHNYLMKSGYQGRIKKPQETSEKRTIYTMKKAVKTNKNKLTVTAQRSIRTHDSYT